ncbi:putative Glutathione S-transferase 1 [Hypsibius exemplaris]|uniref:glutathione transferase n=1 Tax=Hypsibius exemplaris TaxID=2072580 RepID=A0A9X6NC35_HYPEX|nr:putative Glutathione S-transferase 1 [Hypsibius exemplaris]
MAPKYKLHYFDTAGRAEVIRWIFAHAGQEFEDNRIKKADWPALKATTPNGQLPYLEVDGKLLFESIAIARFVARKTGLTGKDDFEAAQADALVDYCSDAAKGLLAVLHEPDEKKKLALKEEYLKVGVQPYLKALERHLQANKNGEGFFVGDKPTWADLAIANFLDNVSPQSDFLEDYHLLKAHRQRVHELKGIKEWLAKRPVN